MMKKSVVFILFLYCATLLNAQLLPFYKDTIIQYADKEKGQEILGKVDDFVKALSPFDRSARMNTSKQVSQDKFLEFVKKNVLKWNNKEKEYVDSKIVEIGRLLVGYNFKLPTKIFFIKTTGGEEGGASAYTRQNAIVLAQEMLNEKRGLLDKVILHELFHIIIKNNPEIKDSLYNIIGFKKCNEISYPTSLVDRKITIPDSPHIDHFIVVNYKDKEMKAVPITFSKFQKYNTNKKLPFFSYLSIKLMFLKDEDGKLVPMYKDGKPYLVDIKDAPSYFKQVGKNTRYIIHPEEILADNFVMLVTDSKYIVTPRITNKMKELLMQ